MMRHLKFMFCLLAALSLVAVSCSKEPEKELSVSPQSIELEADGSQQTAAVDANVNWTASTSSGWLQVSPRSGKGSMELTVKADANISGAERSATITFSSPDSETLGASITVKQVPVSVSFAQNPVPVKAEGETVTINVTANTPWEIITSEETARVVLSAVKGDGNAQITAQVSANPNNKVAEIPLKFSYYGIYKTLILKQEPGPNTAPAKPVFTNPKDGAAGVYTNVSFKWNCSDADGDTLSYYLYLSKDASSFKEYGPIVRERSFTPEENLETNTKYYAKIKADDRAGGVTESDVISFTTSATSIYADGEYVVYQQSTKASPVKLVFTGDGYQKNDFEHGGKFDTDVDKAIEGLFSVEPYKSYREYFTIYKIAAYSQDAGATITSQDIKKSTVFESVIEGGNSTGISCNYDKVFNWVKKIPDVTDADLTKNSICVVINENIYAGTCASWSNGKSIAMVPTSSASGGTTAFVNVICHEYGGHGFGRLADEYTNYDATIPAEEVENLKAWQEKGYNLNVSASNKKEEAPWGFLIGQKDYGHVGFHLGGYYYKYGVWRSEVVSCMEDNRLYFSAISRYAIVKRILEIAGETLTLEGFIAKDVEKSQNDQTKAGVPSDFRPLGKPVYFE